MSGQWVTDLVTLVKRQRAMSAPHAMAYAAVQLPAQLVEPRRPAVDVALDVDVQITARASTARNHDRAGRESSTSQHRHVQCIAERPRAVADALGHSLDPRPPDILAAFVDEAQRTFRWWRVAAHHVLDVGDLGREHPLLAVDTGNDPGHPRRADVHAASSVAFLNGCSAELGDKRGRNTGARKFYRGLVRGHAARQEVVVQDADVLEPLLALPARETGVL